MADPVDHEIILFEHPNFRGAHRHVFQTEKDLNAPGVPTGVPAPAKVLLPALGQFDETTSSIVVVKGTWLLYQNTGLTGAGDPKEVGPGRYPDVGVNLHIPGNFISSLEPKKPPP